MEERRIAHRRPIRRESERAFHPHGHSHRADRPQRSNRGKVKQELGRAHETVDSAARAESLWTRTSSLESKEKKRRRGELA
jgi:hypothetical protein